MKTFKRNPFKRVATMLLASASIWLATFGTARAQTWSVLIPSPVDTTGLSGIASSADGSELVLCSYPNYDPTAGTTGQIGISTDFGSTWMLTSAPANYWTCVASSADGSQLVAGSWDDGVGTDGGIYISRDSGTTWTPSQPSWSAGEYWIAIASSEDGTNLVAINDGGVFYFGIDFGIYHSRDGGATWLPATGDDTTNYWTGVATSSDGNKMVAVGSYSTDPTNETGVIYLSTNAGATWSLAYSLMDEAFDSVASSDDGTKLAAMADSGIYTSTNSGATWQLQPGSPGSGPFVNGVIASSADGTRLYAGIDQDKNPLYVSTNSGLSWFTYAIAPAYVSFWGTQALICSTNGLQVYSIPAVVADTVLYLNFNSSLTGHVYRSFDSNSIASTTVEITSDDFQDLLAVTDDNGGYTLTNLPPGDYEITVSATNYVTLTTNITVGVDQHLTNDFYLNSQLSLTGNVYCNSTEDGVEDASILLGGVATTETDEDGGYIFHNVPADTLSVTVSPTFYSSTNFATLTTNVTITGKTDVQTKDFYVVPLVFGYVYSSFDSNAIIDATVEANDGEANGGEAVTDGGGAYSLTNLFPEDYVVTVSATNYAVLTTNITVGEDGQVTNNFYLNSLLSLTGHIYSSSTSNGLANVSLLLDGRAKVVTDATGAYTITNIPVSDPDDPWTLIVSATNFATLTTNVDITGATLVTTNDYYLDSLLAVEGKVYCSCDSNVITGASVHFGPLTALTDTNGAYAISNVPPGPFDVTVSATRFATLTNTVTVDGTQLVLTSDFYLTNQYFLILATYDPSIAATLNYQTALSTIAAAQQTFEADVADPLCLRLVYSAVSNGLASSRIPSGTISYNQYVADLAANTNLSALDQEAQASLNPPPNTGLLSNTLVQLTPALLDALGENDLADKARNGGPDGYIALNLGIMNLSRPGEDPNKYDLQSVVYHEIDEVLGIGGYGSVLLLTNAYTGQPLPTSGVGPLDLFRYTSKGVRSFAYSPDIAPYFSINGGASPLVCFNQFGSGSDFGDWGNGAVPATQSGNIPPQVQDAFATPGASPDLGVNELIALDIVGYTLSADSQIEAPAWSVGVFSFSAATLPGQTYQLQSAKSLAQPVWTDVGPPVVASGLVTVFTDASATGAEELYRLINIPASPVSPHVTRATRSQRTINRAESVGPTQTHHYLPRP